MPNNKNKNLLKLKNNMMFQLSLTSKELFHSNFLYWIGTNGNMKEYFRRVVLDLSDGKVDLAKTGYTVYREFHKLDLCICNNDNKKERFLFVLENKFKSIANKEQLDSYKNKCSLKDGSPYLLLLTLAQEFDEREEIEQENVWNIKDYGQLAGILLKHLPIIVPCAEGNFEQEAIRRYADFIRIFSQEVNGNVLNENTTWKSFVHNAELRQVRCEDVWQKIAFHKVAQRLATLIEDEVDFNSGQDHILKDVEDGIMNKYYIGVKYFRTEGLLELKHYFKDGIILALQQQGIDRMRIGIEVKDRRAFFEDPKYTKKPKGKSNSEWNEKLVQKLSDLGLLKYMPRPDDKHGYHVFEGGKGGYYYSHCVDTDNLENIEVTLQKMTETIRKICGRKQ